MTQARSSLQIKKRALVATAIVYHPTLRRILVVRHRRFQRWVFPGGHLNSAEAPHEAAIREVAEETGIAAEICEHALTRKLLTTADAHPTPLAVVEEFFPSETGAGLHDAFVDFVYLATARSSELVASEEVIEARWVTLAELRGLSTFPPSEELAELAFAQFEPAPS